MTTAFTSLPVEIQRQCVNYLDVAALKASRLTCRTLRDIAAEALFEVVALDLTGENADKFTKVVEDDRLQRFVRKIHIDTMRADDNPFAEDCLPGPASDWWTEKLTRWSAATLPNVKELLLDLAFACCDHTCTDIDLAFRTLTSSTGIATLTLKHLPDFCLVPSPDITQLANITKLHLLITTWSEDANPDADILSYHRHSFFNVRLDTTWLLPMQPYLTHLTIHTNTYWGVYPCWQPSTLHFPHLTSLALGKWTLAFPWQLALLTSHTTLHSLVLTNCPILHALRMTPRQVANAWQSPRRGPAPGSHTTTTFFPDLRWHTVLPRLAAALPRLTHFAMGRGPVEHAHFPRRAFSADAAFEQRHALVPSVDKSRYAIFDVGCGAAEWVDRDSGRTDWYREGGWEDSCWAETEKDEGVRERIGFPDCAEQDREALGGLLDVLAERRGSC